jgi:hypothetical protein
MIEVYDDLVPLDQQIVLEKILSGPDLPWFLFPEGPRPSVGNSDDDNVLLRDDPRVREYIMFGHNFLKEGKLTSDVAVLVSEMFQQFCKTAGIELTAVGRMKANYQTQCSFSKEYFFSTPHRDRTEEHTVLIYYVNDSDGDTTIFDDDGNVLRTVTPKRGRFLVFDGKYFHAGRHPILADKRIVINFNIKGSICKSSQSIQF